MQVGQSYIPYKLFHGAFVPNWLLSRAEVSDSAKLVFARLCQYAGEQGKAFPLQDTLAKELGKSRRSVRRCVAELVTNRLIRSVRTGRKSSNLYEFVWHEWAEVTIRDDKTDVSSEQRHLPRGDKNGPSEGTKMAHHERPKVAGSKRIIEENQGSVQEPNKYSIPSLGDVLKECDQKSYPRECGERFFGFYSNPLIGTNKKPPGWKPWHDSKNEPLRNWRGMLRKRYLDDQKNAKNREQLHLLVTDIVDKHQAFPEKRTNAG